MVNNNLHKFCSLFFTTQENGTIHIQKVAAPENGTKEVGNGSNHCLENFLTIQLCYVTVNSRDDL